MEIIMKNVLFCYKNQTIFKKLNLLIQKEKITGITGENKTKFLELIDGIYFPDQGEISFDGLRLTDETRMQFQRKVALIPQNTDRGFYSQIVKEEFYFLAQLLHYHPQNLDKKIYEALHIVGLKEDYLEKRIDHLSSGEKKLFQIALALLTNPKVILLDEPFVELDYNHKKHLLKLIRQLKMKYHKTILIASNRQDILYSLVDDVIILKKGKLVGMESATKLYKNIELLNKYEIEVPKLVEFTDRAKKKNIKLMYHKDIKDLIKDIYKHV